MPNRFKITLGVSVLLLIPPGCSDRTDNPVGYGLIQRNTDVELREAVLYDPEISLSFPPDLSPYGERIMRMGERSDTLGTYRAVTLMRFDGLPSGVTINEARLILTASEVHTGRDLTISAYDMDESWNQLTCNWSQADEDRPWEVNWDQPQLELEAKIGFSGSGGDSVIIPIRTATVQSWVDQRSDTPGLALTAAAGLIDFHSFPGDTLYPYLRAEYVQKGQTKQGDFLPDQTTFIARHQTDPTQTGKLLIGSGYPFRLLLKFEIPDSLTRILAVDARLILRPETDLGLLVDRTIHCYPALDEWDEDTDKGPGFPVSNYSLGSVEPDSLSFLATPFFRNWILEPGINHGLLLIVTNELEAFGIIGLNGGAGPAGRGPRIELKYYPGQEPWL